MSREVLHDLTERGELGEVTWVDLWEGRDGFSQGGEDLDAFDGVDSQVGFQVHFEVQEVGGVACLVSHNREQGAAEVAGRRGLWWRRRRAFARTT